GKNQSRVNGLARHEHMVSPDEETDHGNRHAGKRHEAVAENTLAREAGDELADYAHARQNHDVDGRVRIKPEQVLKQNRVAANRRVEDADVKQALKTQQENGDGDDRRAEDKDDA